MSELDKQNNTDLRRNIIEVLQDGLPICDRPFAAVAEEIGISEQQVLAHLREMRKQGIIRRIGVVPNHYALGYKHNLMTVWDIADEQVETLGRRIGALPFVSHCYQRPRSYQWNYNLFAMIHGRSEDEVAQKQQVLTDILKGSCRAQTALRSTRILKKTGLRI